MAVLAAVLTHQAGRAQDPTVIAAAGLLRAAAGERAGQGRYPLLDPGGIADAVEREVAAAVPALSAAVRLPPPLADAGDRHADPAARAEVVRRWLVDPDLVDPPAAFWVTVAAQPVFELAAIDAQLPSREQWTAAACPVCGAGAQVSMIAEESGEFMAGSPRSLWCSRCASTWSYPRATCVACGESDSRRVAAWTSDAWPAARIESCDSCRSYIKSFDLRAQGGVAVVPLVDDVVTAALDLWAAGHGLRRSVRSLAGV